MTDKSKIRWTTSTWNPIAGCSKVSPGCAHCYAETLSLRYKRSVLPWTPENAELNVILHPERLRMPLKWKDPRRIFVNSMSDLFHELAPVDFIADVFAVMARADWHTFQVLTKRPERMAAIVADPTFVQLVEAKIAEAAGEFALVRRGISWPLTNVWLGTSIENDRFVGRADDLRRAPAAVRFISAEPLLGPLPSLDLDGIDWLIVGGESGPGFRPMDHEWARQLRDRSLEAGVAFFFKQSSGIRTETGIELDGDRWEQFPDDRRGS